jgi:hypothetical protein
MPASSAALAANATICWNCAAALLLAGGRPSSAARRQPRNRRATRRSLDDLRRNAVTRSKAFNKCALYVAIAKTYVLVKA